MNDSSIILSFYGDDFTGSTDAMESLTTHGLPTVLFLDVPDPSLLKERFSYARCIGVAGSSRSMTPAQMEQELPSILSKLKALGSDFVHYKVCSTFDSSSSIGNIATVHKMAQKVWNHPIWVPVFAAAPDLKRYTVFGNQFATFDHETYRLDRHPTMSRHPITPMNESDLRFVLKNQGVQGSMELISVLNLDQSEDQLLSILDHKISDQPSVVLFDSLTNEHVKKVGRLIAYSKEKNDPRFIIGSSGVGSAIASLYQGDKRYNEVSETSGADQLLVISGSCSPVTEKQIQWALSHGFEGLSLSFQEIVNASDNQTMKTAISKRAIDQINKGKRLIIYTALGPDDPSIKKNQEQIRKKGQPLSDSSKILGTFLGNLAKIIIKETGLKRLVIAGGDTSSYATRQLDIYALEMIASVAPGAPLCRCYSENPDLDGLELALKSGQFGQEDYFNQVLEK